MRAADLLYRLRSKSDRRKCLLVLTDHARETLDKLEVCHHERMAELLSCYKSEQLRDLAVLLKILDSELTSPRTGRHRSAHSGRLGRRA